MKKYLLFMASIVLVCVIIVSALYFMADKGLPERDNSFSRTIVTDAIEKINTVDIAYNSYYIAGTTQDHLYLGNVTGYLNLLIANGPLTDTTRVLFKIKNFKKEDIMSAYIKINAPYFFLTDGVKPALYRGKLDTWEVERFMSDSAYFVNAEPVSKSSFAIRTMRASTNDYALGKISANRPGVMLDPSLLQRQLDGVFCVDGQLQYNPELNEVIYTYYYRNQYIVMDTSMNLLYRSNTIDTFKHVKIKPADIVSQHTKMLASPPRLVNKASCVKDNYLLINSAIMSQTDDEWKFLRSSVIDVYDLEKRAYQFSFYLPGLNRKAAREFRIVGNYLIALHDDHLASYKLNMEYFHFKSQTALSSTENASKP